MKLFLLSFLVSQSFSMKAQCSQDTSCSQTSISIHTNGTLKSVTNMFFLDNEGCSINMACFNRICFIKDGLVLYTPEFPNTWYEDGKPHCVLNYSSKDVLVYRHFNESGKLIGEEFFKHDVDQKDFFQFTGTWWKIEGKKKHRLKQLPSVYDETYFNY